MGWAEQLANYGGSVQSMDGAPFKTGANSKMSDHPIGVGFYAPWEDPISGFPDHARRLALAIQGTGLPIQLRSTDPGAQWNIGKLRDQLMAEVDAITSTSIGEYAASVYMIVPSRPALMTLVTHPHIPRDDFTRIAKSRILSTVWERQWVSAEFVKAMGRMGEVWVSCHDNRAMLLRCAEGVLDKGAPALTPERVKIVRLPLDPDDPHWALRGGQRLPGPPRFYHIGKWEPRKAQDNVIGAFLLAFKPGEATLMVKTSEKSPKFESGFCPGPFQSLVGWTDAKGTSHKGWLEDGRVFLNGWTRDNVTQSVLIRREILPEDFLLKMHATYDCYVSLSRGEGVDMPALDAKMSGNLMLYTPSGGPQDFAGPEDVCVPTSGHVPADPFYQWEKQATYYDYILEAAVLGYRAAADKIRRGVRCPGAPLEDWMKDRVGAHATGLLRAFAPRLPKE